MINKRSFAISMLLLSISIGSANAEWEHLKIRGIYGGMPDGPTALADHGLNAVFIHSGSITPEMVQQVKSQGGLIFAEYNSMHHARYLEEHPEAAPIGSDGEIAPPPEGWQGVCPNHEGYRRDRMDTFRSLLQRFEIDGIWLDYHHAHSNWERDIPILPDTCFCERCLSAFRKATGINPTGSTTAEIAETVLAEHEDAWVKWRAGVFTDWIREYRQIMDEERPGGLLGTYHCPWSDEDYDGARLKKLAIDLKAQAEYIDVFSIMPYHARFGHSQDIGWISRQTQWLGRYLGLEGKADEQVKIWPIVQLSDWGENVTADQVAEILENGARLPATGIMFFAWGSLSKQPDKVEAFRTFYKDIAHH